MRLDEVDGYADEGRPRWHMIRAMLGIESFGINAWRATEAGQAIIGEHDELGAGAGGHEELYFVVSGRATFTVDGEPVAAPEGSLVYVKDPRTRRSAVADEAATTILVIGGRPGRAVLGLAVGALGRGAALLDDRRVGSRDRGPRGAARRGSRQRERALQPRLRREPRRLPRRGARPPRPRDRARAELRGARARRRRPRRDPRRRPLPAASRLSRSALGVAGKADARRERRGTRARDRARAARRAGPPSAPGPASAETNSSSPTASANALCASGPPKGTSSSGCARPAITSPWVTAPIDTSVTSGSPSTGRDRDRERVRPGQRLAAARGRQPPRRGRRQQGDVARLGEAPHPVAERARREAARGDDQAGAVDSFGDDVVADRGEGEVAERAVPVPSVYTIFSGTA